MKALDESIKHWEENLKLDQETYSNDADDCPLCAEFYDAKCRGCPVYEYTGEKDCGNTPWERTPMLDSIARARGKVERDRLKKLVQREIDFLCMLSREIHDEQ